MDRRLAPVLAVAVATLAACQGSTAPGGDAQSLIDAAAAQQRLRPADFNALSVARALRQPGPHAAFAPETGPLVSRVDSRLGVPSFLWNHPAATAATLRAAPAGKHAAGELARAHLRSRAAAYGLTGADVDGAVVEHVQDDGRGPIVVRFGQRVRGVDVFRDRASVVLDRAGTPVAIAGSLAPAADAPAGDVAALDARDAIAIALADLTGEDFAASSLLPLRSRGGWAAFDLDASVASSRGERFARPARARPTWFRLPGRLVPAVQLELSVERLAEAQRLDYGYVVSAVDGAVLFRRDLSQDATYRVFAEAASPFAPYDGPQGFAASPHPTGTPDGYQPANVPSQLVTLDHGPISTLDPWLPPGATVTTGNNVDAYADVSGFDGFDATDVRGAVSAPGAFDYAYDFGLAPGTATNRQAALAQLFYTVNYLHDWLYDAGFDEAAGNAQADNYGRGGRDADPLLAEAQDWSGTDNARMTTFADGQSPQLEMFLWAPRAARYLNVDVPTSIPRTAAGIANGFGAQSFTLTGDVVLADDGSAAAGGSVTDGCQTPWVNAAAVAGKIALVDRGGPCSFALKSKNAQLAGATGVVIRNVLVTQVVGEMAGTDVTVTIPALLVDKATGDAIGAVLPGTVTVTMVRAAGTARDGALDTALVAHEWGHYLSNRLVGDATGLDTHQSLGLAEGWSDFVSLLFLVRAEDAAAAAGTDFAGVYAMGSFVMGGDAPTGGGNEAYYFGGRRFPYSTDLTKAPLTFRHFADGSALPGGVPVAVNLLPNSEVHNAGEVWASMLWDCYAALLRDTLGSTPRLAFGGPDGAQARMKRYLVTSLQLTPVSPTLLEARDALLAAAYASDPVDLARFWTAFAKRGAGDGALGPDRWSLDNAPVTESFVAPPDLRVTKVEFGSVTSPCDDADGVLDLDEAGTLVVTLENVGPAPLAATTATVSSAHPGLTFPAGTTVAVGATAFHGLTPVQVPVKLTGGTTAQEIPLTLSFAPGYQAIDGPVQARLRVSFDELASGATTDGFEPAAFAWTSEADPSLSTDGAFARVPAAAGFEVHAPDLGAPSDLRLVSPPLEVGAGPLVIAFSHRHDFEADPVGTPGRSFYDGGVVELSADGGFTWTDVGGSAYPGDTLFPDPTALNPLVGRPAFVAQNPSWPAADRVTLNLGTAWARKTVLFRFRVGSDVQFGAQGWWIDDVAVSGLTNAPFPQIIADRRLCASGFPKANAGAPQTVDERDAGGNPVTVHLDAVGVLNQGETYAWTQTAGPAVALSGANGPNATFTAPEVAADAALAFQLTVRYGSLSATAGTTVTVRNVNRPPVAVTAGTPAAADERTLVTLDGRMSNDPDAGTVLTYQWTQVGGPITVSLLGSTDAQPTFMAPEVTADADFTFRLTVRDATSADSAQVVVTIRNVNRPPVAVASVVPGAGGVNAEREPTQLDGSASWDPDSGTTLSYAWAQLVAPGDPVVTFADPALAVAQFTAPEVLVDTTLLFELTVGDGTATATTQLPVRIVNVNRVPTANAGADLVADERTPVTLDGSLSADADGYPALTYTWTQTGGTLVTLTGGDTTHPTFVAPEVDGSVTPSTTLTFELVVFDGFVSASDVVQVTVLNTSVPPVAVAGTDQVARRGDTVRLDASASHDPDPGAVLTYAWTQPAGTPVTLTGATTATPTFVAPDLAADETLTFQVAVSDGTATTTDSVNVLVQFVNRAPTAVATAAPGTTVDEGTPVTLSAAGSFDPDVGATLSYAWTQTAGPAVTLSSSTAVSPTFTAPLVSADAQLVFQVTVTDNHLAAATASVTLTSRNVNLPPTADAGVDAIVDERTPVILNGSLSSDPDGSAGLTYAWTQIGTPPVTLAGADSARPSFVAPEVDGTVTPSITLTFQLVVSDGFASASDVVQITVLDTSVNTPPVAVAGTDQVARRGDTVRLDASASHDPDVGSTLTYAWTQPAGTPVTLTGATTATPTFVAPDLAADETLTFQVTVSDGTATATDTVNVLVQFVNRAPTAVATVAPAAIVDAGSAVTLSAAGSSDPDVGATLTWAWTQTAGPAATLSNPAAVSPTFTAPAVTADSVLVFQVTVTDDHLAAATTSVSVTVRKLNSPPVAIAGTDQVARRGDTVRLDASASHDPDVGAALTYAWTQPAGTPVTLTGATTDTPTFVAPDLSADETLTFQVTVSDGMATATATVNVLVQFVNRAPTAVATVAPGAIVDEGSAVTLSAAGSSDPDVGATLTWAWTQTAGPAVALSSPTAISPTFTAPLVPANALLVFQVTVSDQHSASGSATVTVAVRNVNQPPVALAGADASVDEGTPVQLDASGSSDPDAGTTLTYAWSQTAGPATGWTLTGATTASPTFTAQDVAADTSFTFTVTVSDGALTATDSVNVLVRNVNRPPVANAGLDTFGYEGSPVVLTGTGSYDPDGTPLALYVWEQVTLSPGEPVVTLTNADAPTAGFTAPTVSADTTLRFRLTVSDGAALSTDEVLVRIVNVNQPPTANAGVGQTVDEFSTVVLDGSASSDPDGNAGLTYAWTQVGGPTVALTGDTTPFPTFTAPAVDGSVAPTTTLTFQLEVNDGAATSTSTVAVTVNDVNRTLVAVAGPNQTTYPGETVTLDASQSYALDPNATLTIAWTQLGGPAVAFAPGATGVVTFVAPGVTALTELVFRVSVSDGASTATDVITVSVKPSPKAEAASGGCGCGQGAIDPSIAALLPLGFLLRRRRRTA